MSAHPSVTGAISGAILMIVLVLLGQQLGFIDLSEFPSSVIILAIPTLLGAIVFGIVGGIFGRSARKAADRELAAKSDS